MAEDADGDDAITISLGTEHEFLVRHKDSTSNRRPLRQEVAQAISSIPGIEAIVSREKKYSDVWRVTDDYSIVVGPESSWNREPTKEEEEMNNAHPPTHTSIEVISKAFAVGSRHSASRAKPEWGTALSAVFSLLRVMFRLYINGSMGTHVHMGTGLVNPRPLKLIEVKKLSIFAVVYEPTLDKLFPLHRRGTVSEWCRSNLHNLYFASRDTKDIIQEIADAPSLDVLARIMCPRLEKNAETGEYSMPLYPDSTLPAHSEKFYKLNLHNLRESHPPYTIEWRQCEGTLDVERVCKWIRLLIAIRRLLASMSLDEVREKHGDPEQPTRFWAEEALYHAWHDDVAL